MTDREIFIETVEALFSHTHNSVPQAALDYFKIFVNTPEKEVAPFTENGAKVLQWMRDNKDQYNNIFKSKDISEGLFFSSSRIVSGAMRKLVADGYTTKIVGSPVCYSITENGMTCKIEYTPKEAKD